MIVKYYKNNDLKYASRRRFKDISNYEPFAEEKFKKVLVNDGANTEIKTSKNNLADYIVIDDTRWFVTSYIFMNGGQITMYLQRDVIGENGVDDLFGKVERGYTETFLRNRKELSLNERLIDRKRIVPDTFQYGNYSVDTHKDELWGIFYLTKPTGINPNTGEPYEDVVRIPIPLIDRDYVDYTPLNNGDKKLINSSYYAMTRAKIALRLANADYSSSWYFFWAEMSKDDTKIHNLTEVSNHDTNYTEVWVTLLSGQPNNSSMARDVATYVFSIMFGLGSDTETAFGAEPVPKTYENVNPNNLIYDNVTIREGQTPYIYSATNKYEYSYGVYDVSVENNNLSKYINYVYASVILGQVKITFYIPVNRSFIGAYSIRYSIIEYNKRELSPSEAGDITLDTTIQLVDEPYIVLAMPLFNCNISGLNSYNVDRAKAFLIFNTIIQYLSGENGFLVDAQIYPYCPTLTNLSTSLEDIPIFNIMSNTYTFYSEVQLLPSSDIKKEYIQRKYALISPEQTGNQEFNFYDYKTGIIDTNGTNFEKLRVAIKTSLKPFGLVSCAVIQPDIDSLKGITYDSDFRGSSSAANGFECSLASNQFETYKRQNANYQQIFNLQKDELALQHKTERTNEKTSAVVNTLTATTMGAIGGAAVGGAGGNIGKAAGAIAGGAVAGATVGVSMGIQYAQNEKLRDFEKDLQQQMFDMNIGTVKALPNSINRISSFNEILLTDFHYIIEIYECSDDEKVFVNDFIAMYGYDLGIYGFLSNFARDSWFIQASITRSLLPPNLQVIASKELKGGIYLYE